MKLHAFLIVGGLALFLSSCFSQSETKIQTVSSPAELKPSVVVKNVLPNKPPVDKSLDSLVKMFAQADAIHREAWWVLTSERRSVGKSAFGKVHRALLASQNIKLSNKSMFRCDRYLIQRSQVQTGVFPFEIEAFEKCSEKQAAKKIAYVQVQSDRKVEVTFIPENLEEVLGLGPAVVNKAIVCKLLITESANLTNLSCQNWAQDRSREQMIRLDTYEYERDGKNLIKLRGKVFENLVDTRKIVADIPLDGKIEVLETELYPPVEEPAPAPPPIKPMPAKIRPIPLPKPPQHPEDAVLDDSAPPTSADVTPLPPAVNQVIDADVLMQQQQLQQQPQLQNEQQEEVDPAIPPPRPEAGGVPHGR